MISLSSTEQAFLLRVRSYCADGLNQPAMALREGLTLSGFRDRLKRIGFALRTETEREVVRLRSGESLGSLLENGLIEVRDRDEEAEVRTPARKPAAVA